MRTRAGTASVAEDSFRLTPAALCAEAANTSAWEAIWLEAYRYRQEALDVHGGTTAAIGAGFLLVPSGDWIDLSGGGAIRGVDHRAVGGSALLQAQETFTDQDSRTYVMRRWMRRACAIRIHAAYGVPHLGTETFASLDLTELPLPLVWGLMDRRGLHAMQQEDPANEARISGWVDKGRVSLLRWLKQLQPTEVSFILPGALYGERATTDDVVVEMNPWSAADFLAGAHPALPQAWKDRSLPPRGGE